MELIPDLKKWMVNQMATTEEKTKTTESRDITSVDSEEEKKDDSAISTDRDELSSDICGALHDSGHHVHTYSNGVTVGALLSAVRGARSVLIDLAFVVDWRSWPIKRDGIALKAALLDTMNKPLEEILDDIGLSDQINTAQKYTPKGRIEMTTLSAREGHSGSHILETRSVYIVTNGPKPSIDLNWLTASERCVPFNQFAMARKSDSRAFVNAAQSRVKNEIWDSYEKGYEFGIFGTLLSIFALVSLISGIYVLTTGIGTFWVPIACASAGGFISLLIFYISRRQLDAFLSTLNQQNRDVAKIGDYSRLKTSAEEYQDILARLREMSFIVSPLMASLGGSMEVGDVDSAISAASTIIDECVRFSTGKVADTGDEGLSLFLNSFQSLNKDADIDALSVCYVGVTNHLTNPVSMEEMLSYGTTLLNELHNIGVIPPEIRAKIDDRLNARSIKSAFELLDKAVTEDKDKDTITEDEVLDELAEADDSEDVSERLGEEKDPGPAESDLDKTAEDEVPIIIAEDVPEDADEEVFPPDDEDDVEVNKVAADLVRKRNKERRK